MSLEQYLTSLLQDEKKMKLASVWKRFFEGKRVLTLYDEMLAEYAYFFNGKIYLGRFEHPGEVEWKEGGKQKVLSMLLEPDVIIHKIEGTDKMIEEVLHYRESDGILSGMDGEYNFQTKTKAIWTSQFTGEDEVLEDFKLGEMMLSYFTELHDWKMVDLEKEEKKLNPETK